MLQSRAVPLCNLDCSKILDSAPTKYQLKLKESMYIKWEKPDLKVTVYLQGCLALKRCSACSLSCRYLNPYIKLKLMELAIKLYQEF